MIILNTDNLKKDLINDLEKSSIESTIHILAMNPSKEEVAYKDYIINRCKEFNIKYKEKIFLPEKSSKDILAYINKFPNEDGFIVLLPFNNYKDLAYLRENINLLDLDGFSYISQGKASNGNYKYLPATPKAVALFIENTIDIKGKDIVIANRTNLIGIPLANYLAKNDASVTIINSQSKDTKEKIKNCDIFISAIARAEFYDQTYFRDGQLIVDVGTSEVNGKIKGDIDYEKLKDLDLKILTYKKGIGAITTLILLKTMIEKR